MLGVVRRVGRGRHELGQGVHEVSPPGALEHALALELGAEGDDVDLLAALVQREDGLVDEAVGVAVEVVGGEELDDDRDGVGIDQHGAEHRLLGLEVVRRQVRRLLRLEALDGHVTLLSTTRCWDPYCPAGRGAVAGWGSKSIAGRGRQKTASLTHWMRAGTVEAGPAHGRHHHGGHQLLVARRILRTSGSSALRPPSSIRFRPTVKKRTKVTATIRATMATSASNGWSPMRPAAGISAVHPAVRHEDDDDADHDREEEESGELGVVLHETAPPVRRQTLGRSLPRLGDGVAARHHAPPLPRLPAIFAWALAVQVLLACVMRRRWR